MKKYTVGRLCSKFIVTIIFLFISFATFAQSNNYINDAAVAFALGNYQRAKELYEAAMVVDKSQTSALKSKIDLCLKFSSLKSRAASLFSAAQYTMAKEIYNQIIAGNPSDKSAKAGIKQCNEALSLAEAKKKEELRNEQIYQEVLRNATISNLTRFIAENPKSRFVEDAKKKIDVLYKEFQSRIIESPSKKYNLLLIRSDNNKIAICNFSGQKIIDTLFDEVMFICDGLIEVCKNSKAGIIDTNANVIVPIEFTNIQYNKYIFTVTDSNMLKGIYSKTGDCILECKYLIQPTAIHNVFSFTKDLQKGFMNAMGEILIELCSSYRPYRVYPNSKVICVNDQVVDCRGNKIIPPGIYDSVYYNEYGSGISVEKNERFGMVDINNEIIGPIINRKIKHSNAVYRILKEKEEKGEYTKKRAQILASYNEIDNIADCVAYPDETKFKAQKKSSEKDFFFKYKF